MLAKVKSGPCGFLTVLPPGGWNMGKSLRGWFVFSRMVATLVATTLILALLTQVSSVSLAFTALIGALGMFRFAVANLTQAGALDLAEGRRLEGTMVGLLWGNNALFGALSPLIAGYVVAFFAGAGNDFAVIFAYAAVVNLLALGAAMFLPSLGGRKRLAAVSP